MQTLITSKWALVDDYALFAWAQKEVLNILNIWNSCFEARNMKINVYKSKIMVATDNHINARIYNITGRTMETLN